MKNNLIIIQNPMYHYRDELFNFIYSKKRNFKLFISDNGYLPKNKKFKYVKLPTLKIGKFNFQFLTLIHLIKYKPKYVICTLELAWPMTLVSVLLYKLIYSKSKISFWGGWLTKARLLNKIRLKLMNFADCNFFYCENHKNQLLKFGLKTEVNIANNTIYVDQSKVKININHKRNILFVGSLNSRKKIITIINCFMSILDKIPDDIKLIIVGKGEKLNSIKKITKNYKKRILILGEINSANKLTEIYNKSAVSISYGQAGLSILQSFGNATPFITHKNAISGGEIYNIKNLINGCLVNDEKDLKNFLIKYINDKNLIEKMCNNSFKYYKKARTIGNMAKPFLEYAK